MAVAAGSAFTDPGATASDLVDGAITATVSGTVNTAVPGSYTLTYTAADTRGNSASATRTVTVSDTTAPVLTLPAPITREATGPAGALVSYTASALDAVSGAVTPACSPVSGSTFPLGTTNVACTATDPAGNTASGSFTVTIRDTIAPLLTVPANISVEETGPAGTPVTYVATASDAVTVGIIPVCAPVSGTTFPLGTTTVACTATDGSGNVASKSFTVTVKDTIAPTVTISVFPLSIWSPNGAMVPVTVSGLAQDGGSGVANVTYSVIDEYKQIQPTGTVTLNADGSYSFSVSLQASRKGSDRNGRTYTIVVSATDRAGLKTTTSVTIVAVEHNQAG